jgi:Protein of unknown function (DUF1573)
MRLFVFYILIIAAVAGCQVKDKNTGSNKSDKEQAAILKDSANYTTIQWLDSTYKNFGKIAEGQKLDVAFRFKNAGDKPLVITRVQPSCGCTVAEQPNDPVAPGKESIIKASFNSEGRVGINHKTLFVYANTKGTSTNELKFEVEVEKKKW